MILCDVTESTQIDAPKFWAASAQDRPLVVRALHQTAGYGKAGRAWLSGPQNLAFSCVQRLTIPLPDVGALALLAVSTLSGALEKLLGAAATAPLRHKWPNDLIATNASGWAKMGGVLIEVLEQNLEGITICLGVGVNTTSAPFVEDQKTACVADLVETHLSADIDEQLCQHFMTFWLQGMTRLTQEGWPFVLDAWTARGPKAGDRVVIRTIDGADYAGRWVGLGETGAACLHLDGESAPDFFYALDFLRPEGNA